ncbi:MAG: protein kinase [Pyrinomonadaceae bacterium]|nr:protein kinase [Pyrinomonadaceae bacterium]
MAKERWQKIERIFNEAVLLSENERQRLVVSECVGDLAMRLEICEMLAEDAAADNLLDQTIFPYGMHLLGNDCGNLFSTITFAGYKLQRIIGRGGMGAVILAEDVRLERLVALKVLTMNADPNDEAALRFQQEARAISAISHPNVAHIYEFGTYNGRYFMAMEYLPGETLRELLSQGKLDEPSIVKIAIQIVKSLAAAHTSGIIHRDIKPENVMISKDRHVKVLDFGLAKFVEPTITKNDESAKIYTSGRTSLDTMPGMIIGTTAYMSPEQIRGKAVDSRTDLWSFGVVLFEMLTGTRPFSGDAASDVQAAILLKDLATSDCPKSFRQIVVKLLQKNPADRYQSAEDLLTDLYCLQDAADAKNRSFRITDIIKKHKFAVAVVWLISLLGLSAAGFQLFNDYPTNPVEFAPIKSIAVLPFVNENGDDDKDYLSDGLTESLISQLSRLSKLSVVARSSVVRYKGQTVNPKTIGRELSVQAVLLGRIVEQNDDTILSLDLVDARTGNQIWGKQYSRRNTDLAALQHEMARDVSAYLHSGLTGAEEQILGKNYTENTEAYRLYLKGRFHWNKRTAKDLQKSIEYYEQAVTLDPHFALAFAGLADTHLLMSGYAAVSPHESFPKAKTAAKKALEIDDTLAEAHNALAYVLFNYDWNFAEAEKEIKLAIELNPNYATAHQWYGNAILLGSGRFDEAVAESKLAQQLDPLSLIINADLGTTLLFARRTDEAVEQLQKTIEMDDNFYYAHVYLCRAYLMQNDFSAAIAECQKAQSLSDDPRPLIYLARIYAKLGKKEKAFKLLDQLKNTAKQKYISSYFFALVYAGLEENDKAFEHLEKAFQDREGRMTLLKVDPLMDELHTDPRFEDISKRIRLSINLR